MRQTTISIARVVLFATLFGISSLLQAQAPVAAKKPGAKQSASKQTFDERVRAYILSNPEIIQEAMVALQAKEEKRKTESIAENVRRSGDQLYADPLSPVAGNPDGDVSIVVFYDYFCGYCKKTLPALTSLIAGDPHLRIVYKEFPILGPQSTAAARAALAAKAQGKFGEFHQAMLESDSASDEAIKAIAIKIGLDYSKLQKDMDDPSVAAAIDRNIRLAESLGVNGTPAYLVGDKFIPGAIDPGALADMVKSERAKTAKAEAKVVVAKGVN